MYVHIKLVNQRATDPDAGSQLFPVISFLSHHIIICMLMERYEWKYGF